MTLSVLEGHSLLQLANLFKCDISYLWHVAQSLCICRALCWMKCAFLETLCFATNLHVGVFCLLDCCMKKFRVDLMKLMWMCVIQSI